MSTMAICTANEIDGLILKVLKEHQEMTTADVVSTVLECNPSVSDVDVKRAVWRMIAGQQVELSPEQLLHVHKVQSNKRR